MVVSGIAAGPNDCHSEWERRARTGRGAHPAAPGFRPLKVVAVEQESADVFSLTMQSTDSRPLPAALPGQDVVLRLQTTAGGPPLFRSYSLSGPLSTERYRISVKIEPNGAGGSYEYQGQSCR
jgi:ferredoxin-NADP reductase